MKPFVEDESVLARAAPAPDATIAWGELPDQVADLRFGKAGAGSRPLLALIHGGFWRPAYDRGHTGPMASALAALGWSVASLEYRRVPGDAEASASDVLTALRVLPARIGHHDGRVIAIGHSAGGQLALLAATRPPTALHAALALAPVADMRLAESLNLGDGAVAAFLGTEAASRAQLDPVRLPSPAIPTAILQGLEDTTVPPSLARSYALAHADVRVTEMAGCGHYAVIDPQSSAWSNVVDEIGRLARG